MARAVGIDLGTTNSVVAVLREANPLSSPTRKALGPLRRSSRSRVTAKCWSPARQEPGGDKRDRTIRSVKRHMGTIGR